MTSILYTWSHTCDRHLSTACTSAGPLSLKQNGVSFHIHHIGLPHRAHCAPIFFVCLRRHVQLDGIRPGEQLGSCASSLHEFVGVESLGLSTASAPLLHRRRRLTTSPTALLLRGLVTLVCESLALASAACHLRRPAALFKANPCVILEGSYVTVTAILPSNPLA